MKLPPVLSEGFLQALPEEERAKLGRAGITAGEAIEKYREGQEKQLHDDIIRWLDLHQIYYHHDRMDKRTTGRVGRADFVICAHGLWLSAEAKADTTRLRKEQAKEAIKLIRSGGRYIIVRNLKTLMQHIQRLYAIADGLTRDDFDYRKHIEENT
jgi:hypothetical protein